VTIGKVAAHLYLALIVKELKISVGQGRVVTTLNILFSVVVIHRVPFSYLMVNQWEDGSTSAWRLVQRGISAAHSPSIRSELCNVSTTS
jgi:hypothetical protein